MEKFIIQCENLCKNYGVGENKQEVLKNINLQVKKGEFISIMGPSGCGKSTLLYLLGGLDIPTKGRVLLNDQDINKINDKKKSSIRRNEIGFVFQFYNLVHNLTVEENILLPVIMDGKKARSYNDKLSQILQTVGLQDKRKRIPSKLSGGEQQRVAIARAIIADPNIILADEPIGNLDSKTGYSIMELFKKINEEKKITILQVTHSEQAASYGNRIIRLKDGVINSDNL